QRRRGQAHVVPEPEPQLVDGRRLELRDDAHVGAPDPVGDPLVDLVRVEAADVVGLEDGRVDRHFANPSLSSRHESARLWGSTSVLAITGMKLVSPGQRGTTCMCTWSSI